MVNPATHTTMPTSACHTHMTLIMSLTVVKCQHNISPLSVKKAFRSSRANPRVRI